MNSNRIFFAAILSPLIPITLVGIYMLATSSKAIESVWAYLLLLLFGYPASLIAGYPAYYLLNKYGLTSLVSYVTGGALAGFFAYIIVFVPIALSSLRHNDFSFVFSSLQTNFSITALSVPAGMVAAIFFWFLSVRSNVENRE